MTIVHNLIIVILYYLQTPVDGDHPSSEGGDHLVIVIFVNSVIFPTHSCNTKLKFVGFLLLQQSKRNPTENSDLNLIA